MLTDAQIKRAKPADSAFRMVDGSGLHLFVTPAGGKHWRLRYKFAGKEKLLSIGPYPQVTLLQAREARDVAKAALREGRDPSVLKKQNRLSAAVSAGHTFEVVAREWHTLNAGRWTPTHAADVLGSLTKLVFPALGSIPIKEIGAPDVLTVLRDIEARPAIETARRVRQRMSEVFVYAIAKGIGEIDPAAVVQGAMAPLVKGRQPAIVDLAKARQIIRDADATPAHPVTKLALRILALTAVRPGTLAGTPWAEFDEVDDDAPVWRVPAQRMKLRLHMKDDEARDHLVPLSTQALEAIHALRAITGRGPLAFPNARWAHKPMSENAIGYLLNRAGYHQRHVPHGWRATFSTVMNERFPQDSRVIDFMLAHVPKDKVERAYNRSLYLARRRELAQEWADLLMVDQIPAIRILGEPRR